MIEPTAQAFSDAAREYCAFVENDDAVQPKAYVLRCLQLLLTLQLKALNLPALGKREATKTAIDVERWTSVRDRIASRLDRDYYSMIFEPFDESPSPLIGSLSDDLSDIWRDLKEGLEQFDIGSEYAIANAVWEWRFGFEYHWGTHHSAHAIGALHALLFGEHAI